MWKLGLLLLTINLTACTSLEMKPDVTQLEKSVAETETAFAQSMANRDFKAFKSFLAADTIFFAGERPLRGSEVVASAWKPFFDGETPPFSWKPATVVVQDGGKLALSSGPVYGPGGTQIAVFNSIWRQETDGTWEIIFDKGGQYCPPD